MNIRDSADLPVDGGYATLREKVRGVLGPKGRKVVVFDADGTLWRGDVGETHLLHLGSQGMAASLDGARSAHRIYLEACETDIEHGYRLGTQLLAPLSQDVVFASCEATWASYQSELFTYVRPLFAELVGLGAEIWIVSASHRWIVEVGVRDLGVPAERIIAGDLRCANGCLTEEVIEPFPNGQGKTAAIEARIGVTPRLAFGNSRHDFAMLECADHAVVVWDESSKPKDVLADAHDRSWSVFEGRVVPPT